MTYNMSVFTGSRNVADVVTGVNALSDGFFIPVFLVCIWFILFVIFSTRGYMIGDILIANDVLMSILVITTWALGWTPIWLLSIPVVSLIVGIMVKML